jgi:hypothetical protein
MKFDPQNSILPAKAITPELLSAYAMSQEHDHSQCTPTHCVHADKVNEIATALSSAVNKSREFQEFAKRYVIESLEHGRETGNGSQALSAMAVFFVYVGWELAQFSLEGKEADKQFGVV